MIGFKSWSLVAGIIALLLIGGIVLSITPFVDHEPTHAATIEADTTYYVNDGDYYTRSTTTHYECTNDHHTGANDYSEPLPTSAICYIECGYCNGEGSTRLPSGVGIPCGSCGATGIYNGSGTMGDQVPHSFSATYSVYTYYNIDTGGTIETSTSYSTATKYYVIFNANGGQGSMSNQYFLYGHSQAINANAFTRQGYTFLGWSTNSQATSATYSNGQSVTGIVSSGSTTLYAIWRQDAITVTAQVNNSTYGRVVGGGSYTPGTLVALTAIANDGYAFVEWQDSSGTAVSYEPTFTFTPNANVTYTAIFREVAVIITTSTGGGEIAVQETSGTDVAQTYMVRLNDNNYKSIAHKK